MRELIREYQSVLITSIASMFVFICVYTALPMIADEAVNNQEDPVPLKYVREDNNDFNFKLVYPKGDKIRIIKGDNFKLGDYITISDAVNGSVSNYNYTIYINGKKSEKFDTDSCGGFHIYSEIIYRNVKLQGELLVIIEER